MPKPFELPARGTINYKYVAREDELQRRHVGDRGRDAARQSGGAASRQGVGAAAGIEVDGERRARRGLRDARRSATSSASNAIEEGNDILGKFNPGLGAQRFDIDGAAKFIPKGSDLVFELHYTTSGKPTRGRLEARARAGEGAAADALLLPRRTDGAEPRDSARRRQRGSRQRDHVRRGRAPRLRAAAHASARQGLRAARRVTRTGETTTVLKGSWNFEWQMGYQYAEPIALPKGSKLQLITPLRQLARPTASIRIRRRRSCGDRRTGTR